LGATCRALGLTELAGLSKEDRTPPRPEHNTAMSEAIANGKAADLVERLRAEGCIFSLIASPVEVIHDQAVVANGYLMEHPTHPPLRLSAAPAQFDDEQLQVRRPAPELGGHTDEVLAEIGYAPSDISDLRTRSIVG
jgi:crotonobetainyl-CoA:carnitine CoA-transferase CaiB-like acyl-CoA transferase